MCDPEYGPGQTVLDDILIEKGFGDAAVLVEPASPALFEARGVSPAPVDDEDLESMRARRLQAMQRARDALEQGGGCFVKSITPEEFTSQVTLCLDRFTVMAMVIAGDPDSDLLLECLERLAEKLLLQGVDSVKFIKLVAVEGAVRNFSRTDAPSLMVYHPGGKVAGQFRHLKAFAGKKTTPEVVEWKLSKLGIIQTELEADPTESFSVVHLYKKPERVSRDEDEDW
jgi:hypothetical protein